MLLITRSLFAAGVIVVLSLGASFGVSVLVWQHLLGMELQFMVMAMAVIILLAVGADYNLLLVARMNEEIPAGINTGTIRAMGGSGSVVTAVAQIGTTIGWGLLLDTLVIRAFMTPSIAALVGRWFW
jgi:RND superfamily putative drug exporter